MDYTALRNVHQPIDVGQRGNVHASSALRADLHELPLIDSPDHKLTAGLAQARRLVDIRTAETHPHQCEHVEFAQL